MKIYFAGPLFTEYERDFISKSAVILRENGIDPFVPHEQNRVFPEGDTRTGGQRCYDSDYAGISAGNAMLAILNGVEVDDGTASEIGIFSVLTEKDPSKKGIVAWQNDWRTNDKGEGKGINGFVLGCIQDHGVVVKTLEDAIKQLKIWEAELKAEGKL
jgi:nucleoside 2-deoxyribosyltransferase